MVHGVGRRPNALLHPGMHFRDTASHVNALEEGCLVSRRCAVKTFSAPGTTAGVGHTNALSLSVEIHGWGDP